MSNRLMIVAQSGTSLYILVPAGASNTTHQAQVLDMEKRKLHRAASLQSLLAQGGGYWQEYKGSQDVLNDWLSTVEAQ